MMRHEADFGPDYFVEYFRRRLHVRDLAPVEAPDRRRTISVCTTCMNRLADIRRTLPQNLEDNADYGPAEFVLLDYGSTDGLAEWVRRDMGRYVETGRLMYYRTEQPLFRPCHSRNVSFRLAAGEVVTNVDADNFMHPGFLTRLNQCAAAGDRLLIVSRSFLRPDTNRVHLRGRFALHRADLTDLGGFDEDLDGSYSHEDVSFAIRGLLAGLRVVRFEDEFLAGRIETPLPLRTAMFANPDFASGKKVNERIVKAKLARCEIRANRGLSWGAAAVVRNFSEAVTTGSPV